MSNKLWLAIYLSVSCAHYPKANEVIPEYRIFESQAINIVWQYYQWDKAGNEPLTFGPDFTNRIHAPIGRLPPTLVYKTEGEINCWDGKSFEDEYVGCAYGTFDFQTYTATLAWRKGVRFSESSFAHELCHAFYYDNDHSICHNDGGPVLRANQLLVEKGL